MDAFIGLQFKNVSNYPNAGFLTVVRSGKCSVCGGECSRKKVFGGPFPLGGISEMDTETKALWHKAWLLAEVWISKDLSHEKCAPDKYWIDDYVV